MKLLTAGCGISQISFPHWPTWVKYPTLTHELEHVNIGGPASGNEFLAHNIIKNINDIDCAIIMWTSYQKTDLYIESQNIANEIKTYNTRNFLLNDKGLVVENAPAWWPSSVSGDNRIKDWINDNIYSSDFQIYKTLMCISSTQKALNYHKIPYHMFFGYDVPLDKAQDYGIHLNKFVTKESLYDNYYNGPWKKYSSTQEYGLVPVAGWHWDFYLEYILPILDESCKQKKIDIKIITESVKKLTEKLYKEGVS